MFVVARAGDVPRSVRNEMFVVMRASGIFTPSEVKCSRNQLLGLNS